MCISPIRIINNKRVFRPGLDKHYIYVPCGHCYECVQKLCNEWFVRLSSLYSEWKDNELPVYFLTISWNNDERPIYRTSIPYLERCKVTDFPNINDDLPCFNRKQISQFFKDLRSHIGDGLRFFLVSEFGTDDNGMHLPHYHVIFFLPKPMLQFDFLNLCEFCWSHSVKKASVPLNVQNLVKMPAVLSDIAIHGYYRFNDRVRNKVYFIRKQGSVYRFFVARGYVMYSKKHGMELSSLRGVKYVLKYLHKETLVLSPNHKNIMMLKRWYSKQDAENVSIKKLRDSVRWSQPFHMSSRNIGMSLVEDLAKLSAADFAEKKRLGLSIIGEKKTYQIPRYILKKLMYDKNYLNLQDVQQNRPIYVLNEFGKNVVHSLFDYTLNQMSDGYAHYLSNDVLSLIPNIHEHIQSIYGVSLSEVLNKYRRICDCRSDLLAIYDVVYRDVSTYFSTIDSRALNDLSFLYEIGKNLFFFKTDYYFCDTADGELIATFHGVRDTNHVGEYVGLPNNKYAVFNDMPIFEDFDLILDVVKYIHNSLGILLSDDKIKDDILIKYVKLNNKH